MHFEKNILAFKGAKTSGRAASVGQTRLIQAFSTGVWQAPINDESTD